MEPIKETHFHFEGQLDFYKGKVRDVYIFEKKLIIIATDRISAFDQVLPEAIPFKGQVLNGISLYFMEQLDSLVPAWLEYSPDPNVAIGLRCQPVPIEMVIRAYLAGSAWRAYQKGQRNFNNYLLPEGLKENDPLPHPIITPTTKAEKGTHDEDISTDTILRDGWADKEIYEQMEAFTKILFAEGSRIAAKAGLILADTKYEFGLYEGKVYLIDEIHTPDSARYFNQKGYEELQKKGFPQPQRSKEMVRQWLIAQGFRGNPGEKMPEMSKEWVNAISNEYISLYEQLTGKEFEREGQHNRLETIQERITKYLEIQQ